MMMTMTVTISGQSKAERTVEDLRHLYFSEFSSGSKI